MRSQTTTRLSQGCFQKSTVRIKTELGWTAAFLLDGRTLRSVLLAPSIRGVFCVSVYIKTRYVEAYKSKHFEDMKKIANSCHLRRWKFRRGKLQYWDLWQNFKCCQHWGISHEITLYKNNSYAHVFSILSLWIIPISQYL